MTEPHGPAGTGSDPAAEAKRIALALVDEINMEKGRQHLSSRRLGNLIGRSSQYVSMRLDGGNPQTGKLVTLDVIDLAAICSALGIELTDLLNRARARAERMD